MKDKKRIGIMGGTFNPIHYGHLMIAENAYQQFDLDEVIFLPTGHMPHKDCGGTEMTKHRCEMVRLAIKQHPHFTLSTYEVDRREVNYTYLTLEAMKEEHPENAYYFIMGADSLFSFDSWRCPDRICASATVLAAVRDHLTESKVDEQIRKIADLFQGQIHRLDTPNFNVSSREIRARVAKGESIRFLLPEEVRNYIEKNDLYQVI